ncbi:polyketide synthase [Streptomyces sp. NPDC046237]|uniref:beta-ketoacyl [acyl carrier protein] synthase domain-containing protein n=1 Tax=Streptomyces sp. NPDC046237 TaxID=3154914 RepID=UPI003410DCD2
MDIREILTRYKEGSLDRGSASQLLGALAVGEFETVPAAEASEAPEVPEVPEVPVGAAEERVSGDFADSDTDVVAIVGLAGRYPQAVDLDAFWQNLSEGRDTATEGPVDRPGAPLLGSGERGHFLDAVDEFDPEFFGLTEAEARLMDPQERLFMETAWEALEDAGCTGPRLDALTGPDGQPRAVGVFVGATSADYALLAAESWARGGRRTPHGGHWGIAGHLSAQLRLSGPAQAVDTSWSSGIVAVHHAVQALRRGECAAAVAGAVELLLHPSRARAGVGEGVGAVVLKPLRRALADGDQVYAVIRATSAGGSVRTAAHAGFGLRETRGSTVRRVGDAGAATGIAALTSAVLQLWHGELAPVPDGLEARSDGHEARPWQGPRHAVVAFTEDEGEGEGLGGLRARLVVEEFVPCESRAAVEALLAPTSRDVAENAEERDEHVLLSGPTPRHLAASAQRLADWLDAAGPAAVNLPELARALRAVRSAHPCRVALHVRDVPQLVASLRRFVADDDSTDRRDGRGDPLGLSALPETADYAAALWRSGHVEQVTGLWLSGVEIDWVALEGGSSGGRRHAATPLPASVFLRRPLWLELDGATPVRQERHG